MSAPATFVGMHLRTVGIVTSLPFPPRQRALPRAAICARQALGISSLAPLLGGVAGLTTAVRRRRWSSVACAARMAQSGDTVRVHYEGRLDDGTVFDSSSGRAPLSVTLGAGQVVEGFERALPGLVAGQKVTVHLAPEQAYGQSRDDMVITIEASKAPAGLQAGTRVSLGGRTAVVVGVAEDGAVTVDANHELAGKHLTFDITLVEFRELTAPSEPPQGCELATFAAGCFWGVELAFQRVPGVIETCVGYAQGHLEKPSYEDVCGAKSGHTECVRVVYDPSVTSFEALLAVFWERVGQNATTLNLAGGDSGPQYRSGIYWHSDAQKAAALSSVQKLEEKLRAKVVTEVEVAAAFWLAEDEHQGYLEKGGRNGSPQSAEKDCSDPIRCYG